jgi:hypothetical protein
MVCWVPIIINANTSATTNDNQSKKKVINTKNTIPEKKRAVVHRNVYQFVFEPTIFILLHHSLTKSRNEGLTNSPSTSHPYDGFNNIPLIKFSLGSLMDLRSGNYLNRKRG